LTDYKTVFSTEKVPVFKGISSFRYAPVEMTYHKFCNAAEKSAALARRGSAHARLIVQKRQAYLVGARGPVLALYALEDFNYAVDVAADHKPGDTLEVAAAAAREFQIRKYVVVDFKKYLSCAGSFGIVAFHLFSFL